MCIEGLIVNHDLQFSIFFPNNYYRVAKLQIRWSDPLLRQHEVNIVFHSLKLFLTKSKLSQRRWLTPFINQINSMHHFAFGWFPGFLKQITILLAQLFYTSRDTVCSSTTCRGKITSRHEHLPRTRYLPRMQQISCSICS